MKFYESNFDDLSKSHSLFNFHSNINSLNLFENFIFYGPSGSGKYTQLIHFLQQFSPSKLKFDNKIFSNVDIK
jgi:ABC-type proline/glycine betaine transport system ATPase subunit